MRGPPITRRGRGPLVLATLVACIGAAALAQALVHQHGRHSRPHRSVGVRGSTQRPLYPGGSQRLTLRLRNRRGVPLLVTHLRVRVRVDRPHRRLGCTRRDYRVRRPRRHTLPVRLERHGVRYLHGMRVRMVDSPTRNQDACKGAKLQLHYRAKVRRAR